MPSSISLAPDRRFRSRPSIGAVTRARLGRAACVLAVALACAPPACFGAQVSPPELRLNDVQVVGSHNSYKQAMAPERMAALREANPEVAASLDYAHVPLRRQLDLGLRKLELDVFYDPGGTLFGRQQVQDGGVSAFPVMHVQNLDDRSSCLNLVECLTQLKRWSESHVGHLPVFLSFNAKDQVIDRPEFQRPRPFDEQAWEMLDDELRNVLGKALITPADVFRGRRLEWPALDAARGGFLAVLDEAGEKRRQYTSRWRERAMFANLPEGADGAAIMIVNDPLRDFERIQTLVRSGFIVRTRADADTREARSGSVERRDAAFASGAQLVSTDYYLPAKRFGTDYQVLMPGGGVGRCDPVRVSRRCVLQSAAPAQD